MRLLDIAAVNPKPSDAPQSDPRRIETETYMGNLISTNMSVSELVDDFESGDIGVPEIQRDVVWKPEQIKKLIDSRVAHTLSFMCAPISG